MTYQRIALLIRLLRCYDGESCAVRRLRLGLVILALERRLYGLRKAGYVQA